LRNAVIQNNICKKELFDVFYIPKCPLSVDCTELCINNILVFSVVGSWASAMDPILSVHCVRCARYIPQTGAVDRDIYVFLTHSKTTFINRSDWLLKLDILIFSSLI
jgi:hypothetical protein